MRVPVTSVHRHLRLWLIAAGLVALSGSAMAVSVGALLLVLAALVMPLVAVTVYSSLRTPRSANPTPPDRAPAMLSTLFAPRPTEDRGIDVYEWDTEGGAQADSFGRDTDAPRASRLEQEQGHHHP